MNVASFLQCDIEIKEESISSSSYADPENEVPINRTPSMRKKKKYNTKEHYGRMTHEQLHFFIEYSQKHTDLLTGKWLNVKALWEQLANQLNAFRGPTRAAYKWRETLSHRKNQLRCRARREKRNLKLTEKEEEFVQDRKVLPTLPTVNTHLQSQQTSINQVNGGKQKKKAVRLASSYADELPELSTLGLEPLQNDTIPICAKSEDDILNSTIDINSAEVRSSQQQSSSAALETSAECTNSSNMEKISIQKIFKLTLESIKARDERDERMLAQQTQLTKALEQLTQAVVKLSEKLDKIPQ